MTAPPVRVSAPARPGRAHPYAWIRLAAVLLLPLMVWLSLDFGVTWDEPARQEFGESLMAYYEGGFDYSRFQTDGSRLYGGLFDLSAVALQRILPFDPYVVRHMLNAVFGWLAIVFSAALTTRLAGARAGLLALALLALWPRFFAHSMNNPKDVPFAAMAAAALYAMACIRPRYPWLPARVAAGLALAIGLSLAIRPGGVLFLVYAGCVLAATIVRGREFAPRRLLVTAGTFLLVALGVTLVPMPWWPWLQQNPVVGIADAVSGVSQFDWEGTVLFEGEEVKGTDVPWTYLPTWLVYTTPPVVLAGGLLSLALLRPTSGYAAAVTGLWLAFAFPIVYVIARGSTLYDEIRHVLFVLPPLVALAALGWWWLVNRARGAARQAVLVLLAFGLAEPLVFQVRNHPNQIVYFNALLGGPRGAYGRFELDYWGNCLYQAIEVAEAMAEEGRLVVIVSGPQGRQLRLNADRTTSVRYFPERYARHHLELRLFRGTPRSFAAGSARQDVVYRIRSADRTVLCSASRGPAWPELEQRLVRSGVDDPSADFR